MLFKQKEMKHSLAYFQQWVLHEAFSVFGAAGIFLDNNPWHRGVAVDLAG